MIWEQRPFLTFILVHQDTDLTLTYKSCNDLEALQWAPGPFYFINFLETLQLCLLSPPSLHLGTTDVSTYPESQPPSPSSVPHDSSFSFPEPLTPFPKPKLRSLLLVSHSLEFFFNVSLFNQGFLKF